MTSTLEDLMRDVVLTQLGCEHAMVCLIEMVETGPHWTDPVSTSEVGRYAEGFIEHARAALAALEDALDETMLLVNSALAS